MAYFKNMYITNAGITLYAKAQTGKEIHFTKMQVGSGQIGTQNPATLVTLIDPKLDMPIISITANTELKNASIIGTVNNKGLTESIYICEIGLWATDPDDGEILYGYVSAGTFGDYVAPEAQGPYSWQYEILASVGNAANVTAELSQLQWDYGVRNSNQSFFVISGGNQKEINKSIDAQLSDLVYQTAGGTATAITLTIKGKLVDGYPITFIASASNSGNAKTINGKKLYRPGSKISPYLIAGKAYTVWYNLSGDCFFIKASAEGTALASQVLKDVTFSNDIETNIPGTLDLSNLVSGNIKSGVTINGVSGSSTVVDTADAVLDPNYVVTGYSGYDDGIKKNGQLANLGSSQQAVDTWTDGNGTLVYRLPSTGAFTGTVNGYKPELSKYDANFIASNIASGKSIFGLTGNFDPLRLVAGSSFILASGTGETNYQTTYFSVFSKTIKGQSGTVRVSYSLRGYASNSAGYGMIRINGIDRGTERVVSSTTAVTFTEDFTINSGDTISILGRSQYSGNTMVINNCVISCSNNYAYTS